MSFDYRLYGLGVHSNCPLVGLPVASAGGPVDVRFELAGGSSAAIPELAAIQWSSPPILGSMETSHHIVRGRGRDGCYWRLWYGSELYRQGIEFVIAPEGQRVWAFHQVWSGQREPVPLHEVTTLLLGAVLTIVLRLRGVLCLHASVVSLGAQAMVILAEKGTGKSSLAANFAAAGHPILSDDIGAITRCDDQYVVHPGYPRLRLWPASLRALQKRPAALPPILRDLEKRYLDLNPEGDGGSFRFQNAPLPLGAFCLLTRRDGLSAPVVAPLSAATCFKTLLEHRSAGFMLLEAARYAGEFTLISQLAATVPLYSVECPEGLEYLPALREAMLAACSAAAQASA